MAARKKAVADQPSLLQAPVAEKIRTNEHERRIHALWHIIVHKTRTCGPGCRAELWSPGVSEEEFRIAAGSIGRRWSSLKDWPTPPKVP